jgi:hypothetical protein
VAERRKARVEVGVGILGRRMGGLARGSVGGGRGRGRGRGWGVVFRCWSDGGSEREAVGWLVCGLIQYMYIYVYALLRVSRRGYVGMT